jgi:4-amino-4-deoxy-L-arabinose transferase-like glycosyltransferase
MSRHVQEIATTRLAPGRGVMLVIGLSLVLAVAVEGARGLYRPDEGRYTAVALRMLETGDWLNPEIHHETAHYAKPPLTYWSLAASMALFGHNTFAVRLPNNLAFVGTLLLLWMAARRLVPERPWLPVALYALCAIPRFAANLVTTDTLLTLATTMTATGFAAWRFDPARPRRLLVLMWMGLALGFLTKGPPALLPLLAIVAFTCWQDGWRALARLGSWVGVGLFLVVGLGWYVWVALEHTGLAGFFLKREVAERLFSGAHHRNPGPLYVLTVYLPVLLLGTFPWVVLALRGVVEAARRWRMPEAPVHRFLLCSLALPALVLFAAPSKLPLYVLQLFPPLVLLAAVSAPATLLRGSRSAAWTGALVAANLLVALGSRWLPSPDDSRQLAAAVRRELPFAPREVLFLKSPHMGLALYFDCEVEQVSLKEGEVENGHVLQSLASEVAEPEAWRVYFVDDDQRAAFASEAAAVATRLEPFGHVGTYTLFASHAELEAAATSSSRRP